MSGPHQWLIERIRGEAADLDQVVERTRRGWSLAHKASVDQYAYVDSVALNLHSFYSVPDMQASCTLGKNNTSTKSTKKHKENKKNSVSLRG